MRAFVVIALLTAYKLWLCTTFDVSGDEAHYWMWSQQPDWSYYSKPPLVAYVIGLGTALFGDTEFGLRWPAALDLPEGSSVPLRAGPRSCSPV
jgi:4-amino-4-deoxy-L-arabinose transferase-like glycosyltransferase